MNKKLISILVFLLFLLVQLSAQKADDIVGFWLNIDSDTKEADSQIQIIKENNGTYSGKIIWLKDPNENGKPKLDNKNPEIKLRSQSILGLQLLNQFKFTGEIWEKGTIYDPQSGNTYKCKLWFENNKSTVLHLKGFIGISLIGREAIWIREYKSR
jgi:uncharacterized protein (DUF2147 family)